MSDASTSSQDLDTVFTATITKGIGDEVTVRIEQRFG